LLHFVANKGNVSYYYSLTLGKYNPDGVKKIEYIMKSGYNHQCVLSAAGKDINFTNVILFQCQNPNMVR